MPSYSTQQLSLHFLRQNPAPSSPSKVIRQEAFQRARAPTPASPGPAQKRSTEEDPSPRASLLGDGPGDEVHDHDDTEDPHDLSFTPSHIPQASMVDNLVMSLDQFSLPRTSTNPYEDPSAHNCTNSDNQRHASFSTESEVNMTPLKSSKTASLRSGRHNHARYGKNTDHLPSIFGEDEDSVRTRVYDAQRAVQQPRNRQTRARSHTRGSKSSNSTSSLDLGHLPKLQRKLGHAGDRRSQSFDFGSRRPRIFDSPEPADCQSPVVFPLHMEGKRAATLERRSSTESATNMPVNKTRSTTADVNGTPKLVSPAPLLPKRDVMSTAGNEDRSPTTPMGDSTRPTFFKRFFSSRGGTASPGGSLGPGSTSDRYSTDRPSFAKEPFTRSTTPPVRVHRLPAMKPSVESNKENQPPAITKKPSTFFRRRKKSITGPVPPPAPLILSSNVASAGMASGAPSPVSSLKAFMDPYLTGDKSQKLQHRRGSSLQSFYDPEVQRNQGQRSDKPERGTSSPSIRVVPNSSRTPMVSRLQVPPRGTFLADSSSAEDLKADDERSNASNSSLKSTGLTPVPSIRPPPVVRHGSAKSELREGAASQGRRGSSDQDFAIGLAAAVDGKKTLQRQLSESEVSVYRSAPSTPPVADVPETLMPRSLHVHISHPSVSQGATFPEMERARQIYENGEQLVGTTSAAIWLGEAGSERERVRKAYMNLFKWTGYNILAALRDLCSRLALKGESQLIDRILDAFAQRWCQSNGNHGFRSVDVVHTICYSVLLLNTDLHLADIGQKMTRGQFVRNAMSAIRSVAADSGKGPVSSGNLLGPRSNTFAATSSDRASFEQELRIPSMLGQRPNERLTRTDSGDLEPFSAGLSGPLVDAPYTGSDSGWELQTEAVLKEFYLSIQRDPLPLFGSENDGRQLPIQSNNHLLGLSSLRRTPSTISKAHSDMNRGRLGSESKSLGARWVTKARSRPKLSTNQGVGSSRTSLDDQSSAWSPSMSSTWSKASFGKTLASMSMDSLGTDGGRNGDYPSSIGFANALSQAIIRDDQPDSGQEEGMKMAPLLEDESLELEGAPWAKEGIVKHKCHLEGVDKRSKDRNWNDCFAVIEKGWVRLFSFSVTAKSLRNRAKNPKAGAVVGGGNWQDSAEEVWKFMLRHTIASSLPPPGYSKARPFVWALSLPTGAVHLFSVGTPDIVKEFVSTANYWSARLSKEPMVGGISSMEYGWSDVIIDRALTTAEHPASLASGSPRPSTQLSVRSSADHGGNVKARSIGDRVHLSDWAPPQQSLMASQLMEVDQFRALQSYVKTVEDDLQKHNELRAAMMLTFTPKHPSYAKAMHNWERKSSYLLREIVKFRTYIDVLQHAQTLKDKVQRMRREVGEARMASDASTA